MFENFVLAIKYKLHQAWLLDKPGGQRANLRQANLRQADLFRADLSEANLRRADLFRADLSEANLRRADLSRADLSEANLRRANLRRADLRRADLSEADLSEADLSEADLYGANLRQANLRRADLSRADLRQANLYGADLYGADLYGADLRGAKYSVLNILMAQWDKVNSELCVELMRWDAATHPNPAAFQDWANGGSCPLNTAKIERAFLFDEKRELYEPSLPTMTLWELWLALAAEKEIKTGYGEWEKEKDDDTNDS